MKIYKYNEFNEGVKWYSKGKLTRDDDWEEDIEESDDSIIKVNDIVYVSGAYNDKVFHVDKGVVLRIFERTLHHNPELRNHKFAIVVKFDNRNDFGKSSLSDKNDVMLFDFLEPKPKFLMSTNVTRNVYYNKKMTLAIVNEK